jgi:hypothetical protein
MWDARTLFDMVRTIADLTGAEGRNMVRTLGSTLAFARRTLAALALASGASCAPATDAPVPKLAAPAKAAPPELPSWCSAVESALDRGATGDFRCLSVPNFLVTGFYGPERNPERSDFVNGCFAGDGEAATRLRMSVRPVGDIGFRWQSEQKLGAGGKLDLGFLGPWAPELSLSSTSTEHVRVDVALADAEVRVLSSVAEILAQHYGDPEGKTDQTALEACIGALCDTGADDGALVYTAKVLAAVPVIHVRGAEGAELRGSVSIARGTASFQVAESQAKSGSFSLRAKEKLNVAALLEPAQPAFERAAACRKVHAARARRELRAGLRELGLRTLAGRSLDAVPESCQKLRGIVAAGGGAFTSNEEASILGSVEAIESSAKELARDKPSAKLCAARVLLEGVLTGPSDDNRIHDVLTDVAQPLHRRLTELANSHALPCAEPVWYRDADKDGYGDKKVTVRASKSPPGHVANSLDCYDGNPEARPGQSRYFAQHRGDGSFDFDCDGKASEADQIVSGGCKEITLLGYPTHCWADVGWQGGVPACGRQGRWLASCEVQTLSCSVMTEERRTQQCR